MITQKTTAKYLFAFFSLTLEHLMPTAPFVLICTLAVFIDGASAYRLAKRIKKTSLGKTDPDVGKFKSSAANRMFNRLVMIYFLILLAFLIQKHIIPFIDLHLPNYVALFFCIVQIWSILENESSCNGSHWAKLLQRFMVDKSKRHLNIDLEEILKNENNENNRTNT